MIEVLKDKVSLKKDLYYRVVKFRLGHQEYTADLRAFSEEEMKEKYLTELKSYLLLLIGRAGMNITTLEKLRPKQFLSRLNSVYNTIKRQMKANDAECFAAAYRRFQRVVSGITKC